MIEYFYLTGIAAAIFAFGVALIVVMSLFTRRF